MSIEVDLGPGIIQVSLDDGTSSRDVTMGSGSIFVELANEGPQGPAGPGGGGGGSVDSVNGYTGVVVLAKGDIGLGNVNNTSDANKPISTATQTALNIKADATAIPDQLSDLADDSTHRLTTDAEKATWNAKASKARTATASATFTDEDTSQTVDVVDAAVTALTQFSIDYHSEDFAIQGVQAHVLSVSVGVGYTVIVVAPDGATGQIDLIVTAEEAA